VLTEITKLVSGAGGRGVARSHIETAGGYVAFGPIVVWVASSVTGVLPGDRVQVQVTGDPGAPLMITSSPSSHSQEQGYLR
jgi:hypothetical protein